MKNYLTASLSTLVIALALMTTQAEAKLGNYPGRLKVTAYQYLGEKTVETHSWKGRIREANIVTHSEGGTYLRLVGSSGECSIEMLQENALKLLALMEGGTVLDVICYAEGSTVPASKIDHLYTGDYTIVSD